MDDILSSLSTQAATIATTFALRQSLHIAGGYAISQFGRFIKGVAKHEDFSKLEQLRRRLDQKISIISPAIDLIEIIASRGNSNLRSSLQLTTSLRNDITNFANHMSSLSDVYSQKSAKALQEKALREIENLLSRLEDTVPLISLALTTSGVSLSSSLSENVSPSRLLQASYILKECDKVFVSTGGSAIPTVIGPEFSFRMYSIFTATAKSATANSKDANLKVSPVSWKEDFARALIRVIRLPANEATPIAEQTFPYSYAIEIIEDLDDDRYHEPEEIEAAKSQREELGISNQVLPGRLKRYPVKLMNRLFFSASGRLLHIEDAHSPVIVLKIVYPEPEYDRSAASIDRSADSAELKFQEEDKFENSEYYDEYEISDDRVEWVAFEQIDQDLGEDADSEFNEFNDDDEEEFSSDDIANEVSQKDDDTASLTNAVSQLNLQKQSESILKSENTFNVPYTGSLSLFEYIMRLCACQMTLQKSVTEVTDEQINLFLRDENLHSKRNPNDSPPSRSESLQQLNSYSESQSLSSSDLSYSTPNKKFPQRLRNNSKKNITDISSPSTRQSPAGIVTRSKSKEIRNKDGSM